jgi:hypothetical protein
VGALHTRRALVPRDAVYYDDASRMAASPRWRAWGVLALYVAVLYALLPFGPQIGLGALRTAVGPWLLGPGLAVAGVAVGLAMFAALRRHGAPPWAYGALAGAALCYGLTFASLRAARLERTHLPQYGIAAWLAWRAVGPHVPNALGAYAAAALLGTAIGWGDELVQAVLPNRVYDLRDVALNAAGSVLGVVVLAACRARGAVSAAPSSRRSPRAAAGPGR